MIRNKEKKISSIKSRKILQGIFWALILIFLRIWYVAVFQHEEKVQASEKPQKRTTIVRADRATIHDRFGLPLAINKVQYNIAISYNEIKEIPRIIYRTDALGKKHKIQRRKEYIHELSLLLAEELKIDAVHLEDIIHSRAALLGKIPYVIKENVTEKEFYKLKMLEKDWPGLHAELVAKRFYPWGPVGGEVIGYMGPISRAEYESITQEMISLQTFLQKYAEEEEDALPAGYHSLEQVTCRLKEIEEKVYSINDYVGKAGIEKSFEEKLRGNFGKKSFLADTRGNFLRELPGSIEPKNGNRLFLTISQELQEYAERLLTEYEDTPLPPWPIPPQGLWMKGSAIVVMDPTNGEILTLASYPRFNPNDFIRSKEAQENLTKKQHVQRWLEMESHIAALWDGKEPLQRERFDLKSGTFYQECLWLDWQTYLQMILPSHARLLQGLEFCATLNQAHLLQSKTEELLSLFDKKQEPRFIFEAIYNKEACKIELPLQDKNYLSKVCHEKKELIAPLVEDLAPFFQKLPTTYEKLLLIDLCKVALHTKSFSPDILEIFGNQTLKDYRAFGVHALWVQEAVKEVVTEVFTSNFSKWREEEFKEYLAQKRKEEKEKKAKSRPYIEYLEEKKEEMFTTFWQTYRYPLLTLFLKGKNIPILLKEPHLHPYLVALAHFRKKIERQEISVSALSPHFFPLQELLDPFSSEITEKYLKTFRSFTELTSPLLGKYSSLKSQKNGQCTKDLASAFYPTYGFGYLRSYAFRQPTTIGSIFKLVPAYESLKQRYLHPHHEKGQEINPLTIIDDKKRVGNKEWIVGYTLDQRPIPLIYRGGRLPRSEHAGIGKVDLIRALETSSNPYFALLAGDVIEDPEDLCKAAAQFSFGEKTGIELPYEAKGQIPLDIIYNRSGLYAMSIGQHSLTGTPLQTAVMLAALANGGKVLKPKITLGELDPMGREGFIAHPTEVKRYIFLPVSIREVLLQGLQEVIQGENGTAREIKNQFPAALLKNIVGKTSTAEVMERVSLDADEGYIKCKNIWFGAIYFDPEGAKFEKPKLVVVVYLRYGDWGRKAAPFAVKMIQKYQEICERAH